MKLTRRKLFGSALTAETWHASGRLSQFQFRHFQTRQSWRTSSLVVFVLDPTDTERQLNGKQTLHPRGCSYTVASGIWQAVWLEPVPGSYIDKIELRPDLDKDVLKTHYLKT